MLLAILLLDVACSIAYNNADRYLVIVENKGCIPQMPYDAMVEVPCYLRKWGPEPVTIGNIPPVPAGHDDAAGLFGKADRGCLF